MSYKNTLLTITGLEKTFQACALDKQLSSFFPLWANLVYLFII